MPKKTKKVMNVKELADYLKVHPITIYKQAKSRAIPAFKIGKSWRFNKKSIDKWIADKEKEQKASFKE